jgi:hypothetical protein
VTPVEHFVEAMAFDLGLNNGSSDRRTRRQLLRLTQWATAEGMALDREVILDPDAVERFVATLSEERSAATYRAVLRRVGPLLTKRAPWEPRAQAIPRRQLAPPYSHDEVHTLIDDAQDQPTASRMRAAFALLVLGLGVGLDGRWATRVAAADVTQCGSALMVRVGGAPPALGGGPGDMGAQPDGPGRHGWPRFLGRWPLVLEPPHRALGGEADRSDRASAPFASPAALDVAALAPRVGHPAARALSGRRP